MPEEAVVEQGSPEAAVVEGQDGQEQGQNGNGTPRTYSEKEVSEIVSKRVNEWNRLGKPDELQNRLSRAEQLEKFVAGLQTQFTAKNGQLPGQEAGAPETEEDKKVRAYMEKLYPGLSKWQEQNGQIQQQMASLDQFRWQSVTQNNKAALRDLAVKTGYKEEHVAELENRVADSIRGNREDLMKYLQTGDPAIVKKHFEAIDKWIKGFAPPPSASADYAKTKAKTSNLPPRMPSGGVPAPTSEKKKLTDKERVDAVWNEYKKGS